MSPPPTWKLEPYRRSPTSQTALGHRRTVQPIGLPEISRGLSEAHCCPVNFEPSSYLLIFHASLFEVRSVIDFDFERDK
jgi:hypothetical protein